MQFRVLLFICSAALTTHSIAKGADVQAALQAKYDEISKAFVTKNEAIFDDVYSPKFVLIGLDGSKLDRKTVVSDYKKQMDSMQDGVWKRTVQKAVLSGSTATASVKAHFKGIALLQSKKHIFEVDGTNKDTWVRKGKGWLLVKSQVLTLNATLDGRPIHRG